MNYLIEALFVGFYTIIIYITFKLIIKIDYNIELFLIGFIKHYSGGYSGLHKYYCNNNNFIEKNNYNYYNDYILSQSIYEGIIFIILGNIIKLFIFNEYIIYFLIAFILHIISENINYHKYFIKSYCKKK